MWPELSFEEMLQIAFQKTGLWVGSFDHPLVKQLRGTPEMTEHLTAPNAELERLIRQTPKE